MAEREKNLGEILGALFEAEERAATEIKNLLKERTQRGLELDVFKGITDRQFSGIHIDPDIKKNILLDGGTLNYGQTDVASRATHAVLMNDGRLLHFVVLGDSDEDGDWEYQGVLQQEECITREYLDIAPLIIKRIEQTVLKPK